MFDFNRLGKSLNWVKTSFFLRFQTMLTNMRQPYESQERIQDRVFDIEYILDNLKVKATGIKRYSFFQLISMYCKTRRYSISLICLCLPVEATHGKNFELVWCSDEWNLSTLMSKKTLIFNTLRWHYPVVTILRNRLLEASRITLPQGSYPLTIVVNNRALNDILNAKFWKRIN